MNTLAEKYRPADWSQLIGQEKAIRRIDVLRRRGVSGRAYWTTGASGSGKTSLAHLIAREIADDWGIAGMDAGELTPARIREIERTLACRGMGEKPGRAGIVDEAHGLRRDAVRQLL